MKYMKLKNHQVKMAAFGLVLIMGLSPMQTVMASTINSAKDKKSEAEGQLNSVKGQIGNIENKQTELQKEINALDSELVEVIMNLNILEGDLAVKEDELKKVKSDLKKAKKDEKTQYEAMKKRIRYMYERGDTAMLTALLESNNIADLLNRVEYFNEVYDYDRELLTTYENTKKQVAQLKKDVQGEIAEMEEMQANYQEQQSEYETLISKKKDQVADFDSQLASAKDLAERYEATINEQNEIIRQEEERIAREQEEAERRSREQAAAAAAAAAQAAAASNRSAGNSGSSSSGSGSSSSGSGDGGQSAPAGNKNPAHTTGVSGSEVVNYATGFIGNPYVWGGTDPNTGADCSGFVQYVYRQFGISLPRTSSEQRSAGREVSYSNAQPGDLICYSGHIAIYMGGGQIVHASSSAPYPVGGIKVGTATYRTIVSVRRVL